MSESNKSINVSVDVDSMSNADVDQANASAADKARERARALIGTVVSGRYRIVDLIATGGMGAVYLGDHVLMHKRIAVKILHPEVDDQPEIVARFEREAVVGAHVRHPNIAHATDFGKLDDGAYFLVLDYVEGKNLGEVIREGPMPVGRAVRIAKQIASALEAAHALGIVHRDMKPRNIMLDTNLVPKLIDFGFAKISVDKLNLTATKESRPASRLTGVGVIFGTINYLAPEAAHGMEAVDERADLYALGVMLYEMLAGKHPFDSTDPVEMFNHHRMTTPQAISERSPGVQVPPAVEAVVRKLMEKDPYDRYQKASDVVAALEGLGITDETEAKSKSLPVSPGADATEKRGKATKDTRATAATGTAKKKKRKKQATKSSGANTLTYFFAVIAAIAVAAAAYFAMK